MFWGGYSIILVPFFQKLYHQMGYREDFLTVTEDFD